MFPIQKVNDFKKRFVAISRQLDVLSERYDECMQEYEQVSPLLHKLRNDDVKHILRNAQLLFRDYSSIEHFSYIHRANMNVYPRDGKLQKTRDILFGLWHKAQTKACDLVMLCEHMDLYTIEAQEAKAAKPVSLADSGFKLFAD